MSELAEIRTRDRARANTTSIALRMRDRKCQLDLACYTALMRIAWSTLIVLVLLAPFGRVGITASPPDADEITMPRTAGASSVRTATLARSASFVVPLSLAVDVSAFVASRVDSIASVMVPVTHALASQLDGGPVRARGPPSTHG